MPTIESYFSCSSMTKTLDPDGPLAKKLKAETIVKTNKKVAALSSASGPQAKGKRGPYKKFTPEQKAKVARYALESGNQRAMVKYSKKWGVELSESTIRTWKTYYCAKLRGRKSGDSKPIEVLEERRRGRPLLLGEQLDSAVKAYIEDVRRLGGVVNTSTVIGAAEGIIEEKDRTLLPILTLGKDWAKSLLSRMGYVKRKVTTKGKVSVDDFEKIKESFLKDIYVTVNMEDIPDQLIINWDHTALQYVPVSHWTMEKKGSTQVLVAGVDDKRQLTIILACSMTGDFLPIQAIYKGKTPKCLLPYHFPSDWDVTYTVNHWANEETSKQYLSSIIIPYIQKKKKELGLPPSQPALVLFDH